MLHFFILIVMRPIFFLVLVLLFACGKAVDQEQTAPADSSRTATVVRPTANQIITCDGIGEIKLSDDLASLARKAGNDNISHDSLFLEGNFERIVSKLWKGTVRELAVYWNETEQPFKTIQTIEIANRNSPYQFSNGIRIGTSLKKMVELNGGVPISLYGFGWDYGGTFISFKDGKLAEPLSCFGGVFQLTSADITTSELKKILGDRQITSESEALKQYQAVLVKIRIRRPEEKPGATEIQ
jgi:hypothetical protein